METKQTSKIYYKSDSTEWEKIDEYIDRQIVGYDDEEEKEKEIIKD